MKITHRLFTLAVAPIFIALILSAANAFLLISNNAILDRYIEVINKKENLILDIHTGLGYGQGIHAFKNLVLRGDLSYYEDAKKAFAFVHEKTVAYLKIEGVLQQEKDSMAQVRNIIDRYSHATDIALRAIDQNKSPAEIDALVRIDDNPALDAILQIRNSLSKERQKSIEKLKSSQTNSLLVMGILLLIILILSTGMAKTLVTHVIRSLNLLVSITDSLSRGDYLLTGVKKRPKNYSHDELGELTKAVDLMCKSLNRSFQDLEKANKSLEEFAYIASHDMKSPLRGISNITTWIQQDCALDEKGQEHIEKIKMKIHRMEDILDDLLEYSRIGRETVNSEHVDSAQLVEVICSSLDKPKDFKVVIESGLPSLLTQRSPLDLVIRNLVDNSIKYRSSDSGYVRISASENDEYYVFKIADNGRGIPKELHKKAFAIFQTLQAKSQYEGTGIGLAIVKKAVYEHGGKISLESDTGQGCTFYVSWPKNPREDEYDVKK